MLGCWNISLWWNYSLLLCSIQNRFSPFVHLTDCSKSTTTLLVWVVARYATACGMTCVLVQFSVAAKKQSPVGNSDHRNHAAWHNQLSSPPFGPHPPPWPDKSRFRGLQWTTMDLAADFTHHTSHRQGSYTKDTKNQNLGRSHTFLWRFRKTQLRTTIHGGMWDIHQWSTLCFGLEILQIFFFHLLTPTSWKNFEYMASCCLGITMIWTYTCVSYRYIYILRVLDLYHGLDDVLHNGLYNGLYIVACIMYVWYKYAILYSGNYGHIANIAHNKRQND